MSGINKVGLSAGPLQNSDTRNINRKGVSKQSVAGRKQGKSSFQPTSNPAVDEMKIALHKEGLGNFIDMMA